MEEKQRQIDNMLLTMIQRHFPSLPLSEGYTNWKAWLDFSREVYKAGFIGKRETCSWILTGPDGSAYEAETPLKCAAMEQRERIPPEVALARLIGALAETPTEPCKTCNKTGVFRYGDERCDECRGAGFVTPNVQIEGLADTELGRNPESSNNHRPQSERLSASPAPMQQSGEDDQRKNDLECEVSMLRVVYEAARRVLRFNGVDRIRTLLAVDDLDAAIERVKLFDSGMEDDIP